MREKTNITLIDGWKLVGINIEADVKTSEVIKAFSEIIPKLPVTERLPEERKAKAELWLYEKS